MTTLLRRRSAEIVFIAAAVVAGALVVMAAATPVRFLAALVLICIPGAALYRLIGRGSRVGDPAVRLPITVLLGLLIWLAASLGLHVAGVSLHALSLSATMVGATVVIALASLIRAPELQQSNTSDLDTGVRRAAAVGAAATVLIAAVVLACGLLPVRSEKFTSLAFVDSKPYSSVANTVPSGAPVRLNWILRGYRTELAAELTTVAVSINDQPVERVSVDLEPVHPGDSDGATAALAGAVTFTAPAEAGRYRMELTVTPSSPDGTVLPAPGFLSTDLEVSP